MQIRTRKGAKLAIVVAVVAVTVGLFTVPRVRGALTDLNVHIINSSGQIVNGVASGVTALVDGNFHAVDSSGHIIDTFGGGNLAAPGPIGGTTPSTGQFTGIGLGGAAPGGNNTIQLAAGIDGFIQYPSAQWMIFIAGDESKVAVNAGLQIHGDSPVNTMARTAFSFDEGTETGLVANESMGTYATSKAITIENIVLDIKKSPTCTVSEQIACYDCGTALGACTTGQTSTLVGPITIATGAARQSIIQSLVTPNVAASHYISCLIIAGTCTISDNSISMMARPQ